MVYRFPTLRNFADIGLSGLPVAPDVLAGVVVVVVERVTVAAAYAFAEILSGFAVRISATSGTLRSVCRYVAVDSVGAFAGTLFALKSASFDSLQDHA